MRFLIGGGFVEEMVENLCCISGELVDNYMDVIIIFCGYF